MLPINNYIIYCEGNIVSSNSVVVKLNSNIITDNIFIISKI